MSTTASPVLSRTDVYTRVTDRIIADIEAGTPTWHKPWASSRADGGMPRPLRFNGTPYRGVNVLLLWAEAIERGYVAPTWMTYRQAEELGGQVRRGERGSLVVFANRVCKTETDDAGQTAEREIPVMKGYTVFNVEQIENLPERFRPKPVTTAEPVALLERAEAFFRQTGATFQHGGDMAFYAPTADVIQLPVPQAFTDAQAYAATKAHELIHFTGHSARLARGFGRRFGDDAYAFEELVAELGAAFLCADLSITLQPRADHAAYLAHWLTVLNQDKRAIFTATAHAQRAVDFLHALQPQALPVG